MVVSARVADCPLCVVCVLFMCRGQPADRKLNWFVWCASLHRPNCCHIDAQILHFQPLDVLNSALLLLRTSLALRESTASSISSKKTMSALLLPEKSSRLAIVIGVT